MATGDDPVSIQAAALERLRGPSALPALATLIVDDTLALPARHVAEPAWIARQLGIALDTLRAAPGGREELVRRLNEAREALGRVQGTPREHLPPALLPPVRGLVGVHWSPGEELTLKILDHDAMRGLVKEVLADAVGRVIRRVRSVDDGILGGLGSKAMQRGRGLLGSLSSRAEGLVGAVRDEVEQAFEGRVREQAQLVSDEAVRGIARWVADPSHAPAMARMRVSAMDALLDTPFASLVEESRGIDPADVADALFEALDALAALPDRDALITRWVDLAMDAGGGVSLGDLLDEVGARAAWRDASAELLRQHAERLVRTDAFESWWSGLFS